MPSSASDDMKEAFAARLRKAREDAGLTQPQLAKRCGWDSQSRISMYEGGKRWPSIDHIIKLAEKLGVSAQALIFGEPNAVAEPKTRYRQMQLDLTPSALKIARAYDLMPSAAQEFVATLFANAYRFEDEHPELAALIFTRPDPKRVRDHEKTMEHVQRLSRRKNQRAKTGRSDDDKEGDD